MTIIALPVLLLMTARSAWVLWYSTRLNDRVAKKNEHELRLGIHSGKWRYHELSKVNPFIANLIFWKHPRYFFEKTNLERSLL